MPLSPSVILSVWGRFHAFDSARELQKLDSFSTLITSYPGFVAARFGVEKARIRSCPAGEVMARIGRKLPWLERMVSLDVRAKQQFERSARQCLKQASGNIFVGFSGSSLPLLREAKARGMTTVLERCSTHIVEQTKILLDEYALFGRAFAETPAKTIEQELAEYQEADFVAVPSGFVADSFLRQGFPARKLLLNPYGCDLALFQAAPVAHDAFRIIQVGGVSIRKGFHHVARAFREAAIPNSELWFVGGVTDAARAYFAAHPLPGLTLYGHVPQATLPAYYNQCDIACLGSVEEGLAYVLPQAAACGLPIVCTENTGGREIVGQNECGIVVPPRDPHSLAAAFRQLFEDADQRRRMGALARLRIESAFTWRHYAERAVSHYARILNSVSSDPE